MRRRRLVVVVLVLIACAILPGSPATSGGRSPAIVVCLSPPEGLELPIGQGLEVRCHLQGDIPATLDFRADGRMLCSREVRPGGMATAAWQPEGMGSHVLTVAVRAAPLKGTRVVRRVVVLPLGAPVRIP